MVRHLLGCTPLFVIWYSVCVDGAVQVIWVLEVVDTAHARPPIVTSSCSVSVGSPVPVTVTVVPPSMDPDRGKTLVTLKSMVIGPTLLVKTKQ